MAYLRSHDFSIRNLVAVLKKRMGAADIELVAVHRINTAGDSSYMLKVVPVDSTVDIEKQGFNIDVNSPRVTYLAVVYALGVALYEVHEVINADTPTADEGAEDDVPTEPLPLPEPSFPTDSSRAVIRR